MLVKSVLMEFRPRLQSVNIFIILQDDVAEDCKLHFGVNNLKISHNHLEKTINFENLLNVNSISSLVVKYNYISFRSTLQTSTMSSFKTELLSEELSNLKMHKISCSLVKDTEYKFTCRKCSHTLGAGSFNRVLPLPNHSEPNDWFCHASKETCYNLNPTVEDFFYTNTFFHLNSDCFEGTVDVTKVLHCTSCKEWLGDQINSQTFRLWYSTVSIVGNDQIVHSSALKDCFSIIKACLEESLMGSAKITFSWQKNNATVEYLLIWIMEKNLSVNIIDRGKKSVAKVLYRCDGDLVNDWSKDSINHNVAISKPMFLELKKHLFEMSEFIPKEFNFTNGFNISYISLYD